MRNQLYLLHRTNTLELTLLFCCRTRLVGTYLQPYVVVTTALRLSFNIPLSLLFFLRGSGSVVGVTWLPLLRSRLSCSFSLVQVSPKALAKWSSTENKIKSSDNRVIQIFFDGQSCRPFFYLHRCRFLKLFF